jgi:hypothetical protein
MAPARRTAPMRLPRTTGALSGSLIVLLGLWGALIPLIGPYFHYAFGGFQSWHFTSQRLWLDIVPGVVAMLGGLMLLSAASRVGGLMAGWVAAAAGVWFAIGPSVSLLWHHTTYPIGAPAGGYTRQMLEWVGYFYGLGVVIAGLAAFAMGRYFSRPRVVEEPVVAATAAPAATTRTATGGAPVAERRAADAPVADAPVADEPVAERRAADAPVADAPVADEPVAERRAADAPVADAPVADEPVAERRAADAPVADAPAAGTAPAGTVYPGASTRRRRFGLFRRRT